MPCRRHWQLIVFGAVAALGGAPLSCNAGSQDRPDEPERQDKAALLHRRGK